MGCSPRFWTLISSVAIVSSLALGVPGKPAFAADNQVVFIFGGDVEFSLNGRPPTVRYRVADLRLMAGWSMAGATYATRSRATGRPFRIRIGAKAERT